MDFHRKSNASDLVAVLGLNQEDQTQVKRIPIDKIIYHTLYTKNTKTFTYDIAILKLRHPEDPTNFNPELKPLDLPLTKVDKPINSTNCIVLGWGTIEYMSNFLVLKVLTRQNCSTHIILQLFQKTP